MAPEKPSLFDDSDSDHDEGGVQLKINDDYAKRFEHNKKREERQRLEEKFKKEGAAEDDSDDSSSDEDEDEDGLLATEELDAQINATLQALRNKDPRIYDDKFTFYSPVEAGEGEGAQGSEDKKEKPMTLQDYHRERILKGDTGADEDEEDELPKTYIQQQDALQQSIRDEINAQMGAEDESDDDGDFLKAKEGKAPKVELNESGVHPSRAAQMHVKPAEVNVEDADKDPELFLSNFMASRSWVEHGEHNWEAFESDEGEEDDKAEQWETAYNLRFEDPEKSNEVLKSYARDVAAAKSVRREEKTGRQRRREIERGKKELEKQERREERARLRRLKIEEAEEKIKQIKKVAGLSGRKLKDEELVRFLDDEWDNAKWEEEMTKTFGDEYYEEQDDGSGDEDGSKKKKVMKPKFDDDIDIKDIVPEFDDEKEPKIKLSDVEAEEDTDEDAAEDGDEEDEDGPASKRQKTSKDRKRERLESQKERRWERSRVEALVDAKMNMDDHELLGESSKSAGMPKFAYRETWAESYGLTAKDILMAKDTELNEFVGLKKLAHFRPDDKRAKDKKRLGKKARLRQWRRDIWGKEAEKDGPEFRFGGPERGDMDEDKKDGEMSNIIEGGSKKRKRSRRKKTHGGEGRGGASLEA